MSEKKFSKWFRENIADFGGKSKEEKDVVIPSQPQTNKTTPWNNNTTTVVQPTVTQSTVLQSGGDNKYRERIERVMESANQPGPDYFEFSNSVRALEQMGQPTNVAMQSAFIALKSTDSKFNKEKILNSIDAYNKALDIDSAAFAGDLHNANLNEVGGRENEIKKLEADNLKKQEQIQKLNQEIAENNSLMQSKRMEVMQIKEKLSNGETNYNFALQVVRTKIVQDIQNINLYLQ